MASCPQCGRPVALARDSCLYCGAALPESARALPPPAADEPKSAGEPRVLLVGRLSGADPDGLAAVLGVPIAEAWQRMRREGPTLLRVLPAAAAEEERVRLRESGIAVRALPDDRVRRAMEPWLPLGGQLDETGQLRLRGEGVSRVVTAERLLLIVQGRIHREYQPQEGNVRRKLRTATLEQGYRFHLHLRDEEAPIELDPGGLEFDDHPGPGSSLLRIRGWLARLAPDARVDDGFRFLPPALGPELPAAGGALAATRGLRRLASGREESPVLDNLRQFRYYSAWRGAWERGAAD